MRILYIVTAFPRGDGDVITPWLVETIERLRARGIEVEVVAPSYRGLGDQVVGGVRVHRFRYAPARLETLTHDQTAPDRVREKPLYLGLVPGYLAAGAVAAARLARRGGFDVVHAFWPLPHGLFGIAARRYARLPLVSTFFGVELTWVRRQLPFLAPLVRSIIRQSDAVTAISTHTAGEIRRLAPGAEIRTIPFGAAVAGPVDGAPGARAASVEGMFRLLFVGRLVERKGVATLLDAVAELRIDRDVRLAVVGDGPLRGSLERRTADLRLADAVHFTGFIDDAEVSRRFAESDAFVLPAVEDSKGDVEGLGVVLIEAMQHGVPVIASDSGGIPDVVRSEDTGLLVPPNDPAALAGAIRRLMDDRHLATRLAVAGRRDVAERFSWDRIIDELADLYHEVAARRTAGSPERPA